MIYAVRLTRAVNAIHRGKAELAWLFTRFEKSINKAESLLENLKRAAIEAQEQHEQSKEKAKLLQSDLTYLIEKGNSLADQLEVTLSSGSKNTGKTYNSPKHSRNAGGNDLYQSTGLNKAPEQNKVKNIADASENLPSLQNLR